jgi:hypothetical protein
MIVGRCDKHSAGADVNAIMKYSRQPPSVKTLFQK